MPLFFIQTQVFGSVAIGCDFCLKLQTNQYVLLFMPSFSSVYYSLLFLVVSSYSCKFKKTSEEKQVLKMNKY